MSDILLKNAALKCTPQRRTILDALMLASRPLTVVELCCLLEGQSINRSTIYRTLNTLFRKGQLIKTARQDGTADYQLAGARHCHQMVCTSCGERTPLPECPLSTITHRLEQDTGYLVTGHSLEFTGVCPHCQKGRK